MTEKAIKEFIARLEEASVCFQIHKSDVWSKELEKSRNLLLNAFKEQQKEIFELDESLHVARVGRRDLTNYVKQLKEEKAEYAYAIEEIKQFLKDEIKYQEANWSTDDHSGTVEKILDKVEDIEKKWNK